MGFYGFVPSVAPHQENYGCKSRAVCTVSPSNLERQLELMQKHKPDCLERTNPKSDCTGVDDFTKNSQADPKISANGGGGGGGDDKKTGVANGKLKSKVKPKDTNPKPESKEIRIAGKTVQAVSPAQLQLKYANRGCKDVTDYGEVIHLINGAVEEEFKNSRNQCTVHLPKYSVGSGVVYDMDLLEHYVTKTFEPCYDLHFSGKFTGRDTLTLEWPKKTGEKRHISSSSVFKPVQ